MRRDAAAAFLQHFYSIYNTEQHFSALPNTSSLLTSLTNSISQHYWDLPAAFTRIYFISVNNGNISILRKLVTALSEINQHLRELPTAFAGFTGICLLCDGNISAFTELWTQHVDSENLYINSLVRGWENLLVICVRIYRRY